MARDGAIISVSDDVGLLRDVLVQGPVCALPGRLEPDDGAVHEAVRQHARFVAELKRAGVIVRHLDQLLCSALGFADARDWIVERRVGEYEDSRRLGAEIVAWLSEKPAETLTRLLMEGMPLSALPPALNRPGVGAGAAKSWFLPPLSDMTQVRSGLRFIDAGAVVCPLQPAVSRASAITFSTVLNFAPLFDEARFEFWLSSDGADRSCPPIDGHDIAMPGGLVCVAAITQATGVLALSELAAALFRKNKDYTVFWLDLTGTGGARLDDCFVPFDRDCLLVNSAILDMARAFAVHPNRHGMALTVEPCRSGFLEDFARASGARDLCLIDARDHAGAVGTALSHLAPILLSPRRILAFEEHEAAFGLLEQHGIEIVAVLKGSALTQGGKGPRGLISALRAG
ncbi:MAG: arginine deiminase family protein [Hoeflea sp.]|uniref:arginine deiminase family protein n=1 Tax=Hoeflea sp. TaxID=1940281 RepID=UPI0027300A46|nr:arginine deiminase family protein [Hoeflea sp.]MDP2122452.1 arginine deiminase family protein [Hoeflea sp.]MDP3524399.1 arginine deiminase family protein [Hoeflea sp.]